MDDMHFEIESNIDFDNIVDVDEYQSMLEEQIHASFTEVAKRMQQQAKKEHRYKRRTGKLRAATRVDAVGTTIDSYIGERAPYGKYVHYGQRSWQPDPFITKAVEGNLPMIEQGILRASDNTFNNLFNTNVQLWRMTYGE